MKKLLFVLLFLPSICFADVWVSTSISTGAFIQMRSDRDDGEMRKYAVASGYLENDVTIVQMMENDYKALRDSDAQWAANATVAKVKRLGELRTEAKTALQSMTGYALGNATQRSTIQASLRQAYLDAKTAIMSCVDIACVRAVQPSWPADPGE